MKWLAFSLLALLINTGYSSESTGYQRIQGVDADTSKKCWVEVLKDEGMWLKTSYTKKMEFTAYRLTNTHRADVDRHYYNGVPSNEDYPKTILLYSKSGEFSSFEVEDIYGGILATCILNQ